MNLAGIGIFGLRLDYPVFKDGSIFGFNDAPTVEIKRAQRDALAWTAHLTREDVIYRITQVFVDTVSAQNRAEPVDRRVELLQRSLDIHKRTTAERIGAPDRCRGCHKTTQWRPITFEGPSRASRGRAFRADPASRPAVLGPYSP